MAIAALILGICAIVFSIIPCTWFVGLPCAILAVIFGIVGLKKVKTTGKGKGSSLTGLILGTISLLIAIVWIVLSIVVTESASSFADEFKREFDREMKRSSRSYDYESYDSSISDDMKELEKAMQDLEKAAKEWEDLSKEW